MTARENLLAMLRRQGYETVPLEFSLCPSLEAHFKRRLGESVRTIWNILICPGGGWGIFFRMIRIYPGFCRTMESWERM